MLYETSLASLLFTGTRLHHIFNERRNIIVEEESPTKYQWDENIDYKLATSNSNLKDRDIIDSRSNEPNEGDTGFVNQKNGNELGSHLNEIE